MRGIKGKVYMREHRGRLYMQMMETWAEEKGMPRDGKRRRRAKTGGQREFIVSSGGGQTGHQGQRRRRLRTMGPGSAGGYGPPYHAQHSLEVERACHAQHGQHAQRAHLDLMRQDVRVLLHDQVDVAQRHVLRGVGGVVA